ncbi:hypothetical protein LZD49_07585 [Dyadobacter sp. CY261]|uniref:hypothetical protein n=1 Tax=Dyadobacter sp. CY261 TaxID=2907203 RepID=UPI001F362852|nr:hypothetical protein [Dyadobacter sp. CY261]MCF0070329.1 hypothetical protein [Dyadobacter sp. CY261]
MNSRYFLFSGIFAVFLLLLTEILLRIGLLFFGYSFLRPSDHLYSGFYHNMQDVRKKEIRRGGDVKNVLILGGSVVSSAWTHMESRLDTILQKHYGKRARFAFYNVADAGHTSRDNAVKYSLLEDKRFDLVLYYEAINENRANNVPAKDFRQDYSHMRWYRDIYLLQAHPEINITVIPYLLDKVIGNVKDRLEHRVYISHGEVDPQFAQYGSDIKTKETYRRNLEEIIATAKKRGDKLLLMSYASFFPENVVLTGEEKDMEHFAGCNRFVATPVVMWGRPENVKKGVDVHNRVLRELVSKYNTLFLDLEHLMPKDQKLFCDVCHLSGPGAKRLAHEISGFIIQQKLLE